MKQYKHKKSGKVVQEVDPKSPYAIEKLLLSSGLKYKAVDGVGLYEAWIIEDSLDWELVVSKAYEILAGGDKAPITKIKRLSDGVIFEVGDLMGHNIRPSRKLKIKSIDLEADGTLSFNTGNTFLHNAILIKPTLISEDGVKLYEGDSVYIVENRGNLYLAHIGPKTSSIQDKSIKVFSTKKVALNYMVDNAKCISYLDLPKCPTPIAAKQFICKQLGINYADL